MIKRFVMTILGAVAGLIVIILGFFGVAGVTSKMIVSGVRRYAREILVSWYLATLLPLGGSTLIVNNVWWGVLFFPALRFFGPGDGEKAPKNPLAHNIVCFVGCFVPPWGLYSMKRSRPFLVCSLFLAANALVEGGDLGQAYWAAVFCSLALWGWGFVKKPLQRFGGEALKGIKIIIAAGAAWFVPPLGIVLIPLFFAEGDVRWGGVALQCLLNAILWLGGSALPIVGWIGSVAAYGHVIWFWWNNRAK